MKYPTIINNDLSTSLLQAMIRGELDVLKDWCYEAVSDTLPPLHLYLIIIGTSPWFQSLFGALSMSFCQSFVVFTNRHNLLFRNRNPHKHWTDMLAHPFQLVYKYVYVSFFMPDVFSCTCPQTYSQLAHPIQQARALGLLFQSKILDIDNIDVSAFIFVLQQSHTLFHTLLQSQMSKVIPVIIFYSFFPIFFPFSFSLLRNNHFIYIHKSWHSYRLHAN